MLRSFLRITHHIPKHNHQRQIQSYSLQSLTVISNNIHARQFTTDKGDDETPKEADAFGIEDTTLPPKYKRDPITGKFTGETEMELSPEEEKLLNDLSNEEVLNILEQRVISKNDWDEDEVAMDVRAKNAALNILGRRANLQPKEVDTSGKALSGEEFEGFQDYLKKEEDLEISKEDVDVDEGRDTEVNWSTDEDLAWVAKSSKKDAWLEEIMPYDLAPQKKVNRRDARPIPKELLHHNNIELLRRYTTPGGQILPRGQSRLGAKDQRKIARLVKRSRALGLIPCIGQWKLEDKGCVEGGEEKFWWEEELEKKGFVLPKRFTDVHKP